MWDADNEQESKESGISAEESYNVQYISLSLSITFSFHSGRKNIWKEDKIQPYADIVERLCWHFGKKSKTSPLSFIFPEREIIFLSLWNLCFQEAIVLLEIFKKSNQAIIFICHNAYVFFLWWQSTSNDTELLCEIYVMLVSKWNLCLEKYILPF